MINREFIYLGILLCLAAVSSFAQENVGPIVISELVTSENQHIADEDDEYHDWIELYNLGDTPVDITGWHLTDSESDLQKWTFSNGVIELGEFELVFASGKDIKDSTGLLHTNFSLASDGEFLAIVNPNGQVSHSYSPTYPNQDLSRRQFSYGLVFPIDPASIQEAYFLTPSPLLANGEGVTGFLNSPTFSHKRGFYDAPFELSIFSEIPNSEIRYTTDGSIPERDTGLIYSEPILVSTTSIVRAVVFHSGLAPSEPITQTYLFLEDVIHQQAKVGLPARWANNVLADYEMDSEIVNHSDYAHTIIDDLKSIPTVSFVMNPVDLFGSRGIYVNPEQKGIGWERASSTEWIYADDRESLQINNGIRIQGGFSRVPDRKKHSFRLLFKRDYGPPKLKHTVFDHSPVDEFNTITFRGNYNYTWHGGEGRFNSTIGHAEYMRDEFSRRTQLDAGQPASHGTYVHLYLNGMYWGVYNIAERPDDAYSESYFGGEREDYDVVTGGSRGTNVTQVKAGNKNAWNEMMGIVRRGDFHLQENYEAIQQYVDIKNLIDYMLVIFYTGNRDAPTVISGNGTPWNFYTTRLRQPGAGLKTYVWDSEWCLEEPGVNVVEFHRGQDNPALIFQQLRSNPEFLVLVADRIQTHFFNKGALTADAALERYSSVKAMIDRAIVGESARWGDARNNRPRTRNEDWLDEVNRLLTTYFPVRTDIVLQQLKDSNIFPEIDAPVFNRESGTVYPNFALTMDSQVIPEETASLIEMTSEWKYEQSGIDLGSSWKNTDYDDSSWSAGNALLYVENSNLPAPKNTLLHLGQITYYFRNTFTVDPAADLSQTTFHFETIVDDGAVIYINGQELFRIRMNNGAVRYQTTASGSVTNAVLEGTFSFPGTLFQHGENVIAVEVHQTNANSSDIVFGLQLRSILRQVNNPIDVPIYFTTDGSDPRLSGGGINPDAVLYTHSLLIDENRFVTARAFFDQEWSAVNTVALQIDSQTEISDEVGNYLRVTELMYDPLGGGEMEYIELHNIHPVSSLRLDGLSFTQGIQYTFPENTIILPGGYLLVTKAGTPAARIRFENEYQLNALSQIVGPYVGQFANEGERITLSSSDEAQFSFEYRDTRGWHIEADGAGHSLVPLPSVIHEEDQTVLDYGGNWRGSFSIGGSPGTKDPVQNHPIRVNEFMASTPAEENDSTNPTSNDWIELYNASTESVNLTNWFLSDDKDDLKKWGIPSVQVSALGLISFDEINDFHRSADRGFGLNSDGEEIYLSYLPSIAGEDRVVDAVSFQAQEKQVSYGRFEDGGDVGYRLFPTRNTPNRALSIPVVIDEIMYAPMASTGSSGDEAMYEYIEIYNQSNEDIHLGLTEEQYRLGGGIEFEFPLQSVISANERIVLVRFDPNDEVMKNRFRTHYGVNENDLHLIGPFTGRISNQGERIALEKVRSLESIGLPLSWIIMDEVIYFSKTPWTSDPVDRGLSLQRVNPGSIGNHPQNWSGENPSPGSHTTIETKITEWYLF